MYTSTNNSIILSVLNKLFSFDSVDVPTFLLAFALVGKTSGIVKIMIRCPAPLGTINGKMISMMTPVTAVKETNRL